MPLYEYHCEPCNLNFDRLMPMELRESARCDCGIMAVRVFTTPHIRSWGNKFTKDGPGFQSINMSKDEYNHRVKERSLDEGLKQAGNKPLYFSGGKFHAY